MARIKIDKSDLLAACDSLEGNCFLHFEKSFDLALTRNSKASDVPEREGFSIDFSPDGGHHVHRLNEINTCSSAAWKFIFFLFCFHFEAECESRNVC
jgi:hypothetical protein